MKKIHAVALCLGSVAASTIACTSLLGDFEVAATAPDSGPGTGLGDGASVSDASNDVVSFDAAGDSATDFASLTCAEVPTTKIKLGVLALGAANNNRVPDSVWVTSYPQAGNNGARAVAIAPDSNGVVHAFVFDANGGGASNIKDVPIPGQGQLLATKRYPGGVAALIARSSNVVDGGSSGPPLQIIDVVKLPDDGVWSQPIHLTQAGDIGIAGATSCVQRLTAAFNVRDAASDDYDVVFTYQEAVFISAATCGAYTARLKAAHVKGGPTATGLATWPVPTGVANLDVPEDGIIISPSHAYVMVNPGSGNGSPPPGLAPYMMQADNNTLAYQSVLKVPLKDQQDFLLGGAMKQLPPNDSVGVAFLEANLGSASAKPTFYVGTVPAANLAGITPSAALPATELGGVTDIPVDKSRYHWESFVAPQAPSHNFLAIARAFPSGVGFNFLWWDGQGRLRSQRTAGTGGVLAKPTGAVVSLGAGITLLQAPNVQLATMQMVWLEDPGQQAPYDVWSGQVICTK